MEGFQDQILLDLFQGIGQSALPPRGTGRDLWFSFSKMEGEVLSGDDVTAAEDHRPLDQILQLSHVSGVGIPQQDGSGLFREIGDHFLVLLGIFLEKMVDQQRKVTDRWRAIDSLIGSATGKTFRVFAQGLTFEALLGRANHHLAQLSPRYHLLRVPGSGLDLQVLDRYLARAGNTPG